MSEMSKLFREETKRGRGGRAPKNGCKSKKCTLPHELLSQAEVRKLSGPCINTNRPVLWEDFYQASSTWKIAHLRHLINTFGATFNMITTYFCVGNEDYLLEFMAANGIEPRVKICPRMLPGWLEYKDFRKQKTAGIEKACKSVVVKDEPKPEKKKVAKQSAMTINHEVTITGSPEDVVNWLLKNTTSVSSLTVKLEYKEE